MSEIVEMQDQGQREIAKPYQAPAQTTPADLLRIAVEQGADLDKLERLMDLQDRYNASQARRAYDSAFAAFKAEGVKILKGRKVSDGPLKGKSYAELHDVVNAVTPALSKHGLSSSWKLTKDEPAWMEVTCYLRHVGGHEESASMGGPPDTGGAKNAIQARASTKSYLERYTLKGITGLSEEGDDNDGNGDNKRPCLTNGQIAELRKAISVAGIDEAALCARVKINRIEELQQARFQAAMNWLQEKALGGAQ